MADTTTTTYALTKPEVGASANTWGTKVNANLDAIDDLLDGTTIVTGIKMDDTFSIVDNADNTKVVNVQLSGITTGTTRTWAFPDASDTFVGLTATQTLTNKTLPGYLKADTHDTLEAGFDSDVEALGTITSGTVTPEVDADTKENFKTLTNNGAFTLAPPSTSSACTIMIQVTNGASAGAITRTGFTVVNGDTYETTNGNDYFFHIKKIGSFTSLTIEALQ